MAYVGDGSTQYVSFLAGSSAQTTTSQYSVGYISAANTVSVINTNTSNPVGIIDSYQSAGSQTVRVITAGLAKAYAGASIAAGSLLMPQTGTALVITAAATITSKIIGTALEAASTNGALTINVHPMGI